VRAVNRAPVANAGPDMNAVTGRTVILDGAQSFDPDRDPLSFAWQFVAVPATSSVTTASLANAQTAAPSFTPDVDGTYGLELTVSDGTLSSTDQAQVTAVSRPNVPPNANAGQDQTAQVGTVVLLDGRGSQDPDNGPQPLTFQWSFVAVPSESILTNTDLQGATTPLANFTPDVVGVYRVSLQVSDGRDTSQAEVQITAALQNVEPNADAGLPMVVQLGAAATLNGTASHDPDHGPQPLTYQWTLVSKPAASGLTNASIHDATTATPRFTPDVAGFYVLRLDVSDGALSDFAQVLVKANVAPVAADDTFDAKQDQPLTVLAPGVLSNDTDGNNDSLTVVLGNTVNHGTLTLNADGSFTYTPTTGFLGTDSFTYQASDGSVDSNMAAVTITVQQGSPKAITLTPNPLTLTPSTTGSVTAALIRPAGAAGQVVTLLSSNSTVASVPPSVTIPANASSTAVTVTAGTTTGAAAISASAPGLTGGSTTVNVRCPTLTVTPPGVTTGILNVPFSQSFSQSGALGTATFTVASGTLPPGLTLASSGLLAGMPTQTGSFPITVRVTDTNGCTGTSAPYPLSIGQVPALTSANATTFTVGAVGMFTITATGSPAPTFAAAGTLPAGVTLHSTTGVLAGTPGPGTAGIYPLTITASNGIGLPVTQLFTLTVLCVPITVNPVGPALAEGMFGVAYSQTFTASGGTAPHSFTLSAGAIPAGLTLALGGGLTGSPMNTGNFSFTVTATDVNLCPGSTMYTLSVRPNAQPETFANGVGNTQYVVVLAAPATPPAPPAVVVVGSVLNNDAGSGALNAGPASITSANGSVAMNPNGTFTYTPAVGFAGPSDTFTYTLTDSSGMTNTALVTINLSEVVWYVNSSGANGDGRSHSPFNTLNGAQAQSDNGHTIFVHTSAVVTPDGIVLKPSQTLWGQGAMFMLNGLTILAAADNPKVTGTITLAANATVSSLDINTGPSMGITDPVIPITGVHIKNDVTVTTTTGALSAVSWASKVRPAASGTPSASA
jgi:VCBS repeat-containing protein